MIHVNLLPEEYRRKNRTPIKMMLAVSGAVAVNGIAIAWFAWLALGVSAEIQSEHDVLQTELEGLTPQVTYHKSLEGEQTRFAAREQTLASITQSRINWTRKVDELITVVNSGGGGDRHFVWLDDLNVTQTEDARSQNAGSVKASGHSGSENFAQVANFLEDLENSPFIHDFQPPAPPEGTQTLVDKDLIPSEVWAFPLSLDLKSAEERQSAEEQQRAEAQAQAEAKAQAEEEQRAEEAARAEEQKRARKQKRAEKQPSAEEPPSPDEQPSAEETNQ